jgi:hypothetical protein
MIKNSSLLKKTLVIGIIAIFLGIGIQPAIANIQPKDNLNIANNPNVKILLDHMESVEISDTVIFDEPDKIVEIDEKLSNRLSAIKEINNKLSFSKSILDNILLKIILKILAVTFVAGLSIVIVINLVTSGRIQLFYWLEVALWYIYWEFIHDLLP